MTPATRISFEYGSFTMSVSINPYDVVDAPRATERRVLAALSRFRDYVKERLATRRHLKAWWQR